LRNYRKRIQLEPTLRVWQKLKAAGAPDLIETVYGMGYRLKLPSGQEITAPLAGTGANEHSSRPWTKCKGFGSVVKKFSNRVAVLDRLPQTSKTLLPMNCGFMLRKRPTS